MTEVGTVPVTRHVGALRTLDRALQREIHNLARWPRTLWQQMHKSLQWDETTSEIIAQATAERTRTGTSPWARVKTRRQERSALVRTLAAHAPTSDERPSAPQTWITDCAFNPTGDLLASASHDVVVVWDLATGADKLRLDSCYGCAFSPDGSTIVAGAAGLDGGISVWDARTGALLQTSCTSEETPPCSCCAVSLDGSLIVSGHGGYPSRGDVETWDAATLQQRWPDKGETLWFVSPILACAVAPDASRVFFAEENRLGIIEMATAEIAWRAEREELSYCDVYAAAVSPDWRRVAAGFGAGVRIMLFDLATGERTVLGDGEGMVNACCFSPDGLLLAAGREDGIVELWDVGSGERRGVLIAHAEGVTCCSFSPDGALLVTGGRDRMVRVWDLALVGEDVGSMLDDSGAVRACVAAPDGSLFLSAGAEGQLATWDPATGERLRVLKPDAALIPQAMWVTATGQTSRLRDCAVSPDASFAISIGPFNPNTAQVVEWNLETGHSERYWHVDDVASSCTVSPDGQFLVSVGNTVRIWDQAWVSGPVEELRILGQEAVEARRYPMPRECCAVSPDGSYLVAAGVVMGDYGMHGLVQLWDPQTGDEIRSMVAPATVRACAVSPDGDLVVGATAGGHVSIWDAASGEVQRSDRWHQGDAHACAVTPDGMLVASAGSDHTVRLRRISDGVELLTLPVPGPTALALHPWLPILAWGDAAGSVFVAELVGVDYEPIVVLPTRQGKTMVAHCPACATPITLTAEDSRRELQCPNNACALALRTSQRVRSEVGWRARRRWGRRR